mgnify:FL=1
MELAIDACSIILLAKATVLEEFTKWKKTMITEGVYNEVLEGKDKQFLDALLLERLVEEKKISVEGNLRKKMIQKLMNDFGVGIGEAGSIALALESKGKTILTDNKQGRKAAKVHGLKLLGSVEVVTSLFKKGKISKEKTISALRTLKDKGWFQDHLIEGALEEVQNG